MRSFLIALLILLFPWLPAQAIESTTGGGPLNGSLTVTVVRAEEATPDPIPNAFVMVGYQVGNPFSGNTGFTGPDGTITFTDAALDGPQMVSAGAEGYQYFSFVEVDADDLLIALEPLQIFDPVYPPGSDYAEISGTISGFEVDNGPGGEGDGEVDAGLVLRYLTVEEALGFESSGLLAPEEEFTLSILTINIPENLVFPEQTEWIRVIIVPILIDLNKPTYIWPTPDHVDQNLLCMAGRISAADLSSWLDDGTYLLELISLLSLYRIGLSGQFLVDGATTMNFSLTNSLNGLRTVNFHNTPDGHDVFLLSAGDVDGLSGNGHIVPLGFELVQDSSGTGSAQLTSILQEGEFSALTYLAGATAVNLESNGEPDLESGMSALIHRELTEPQTEVTLDSFFNTVDGYFVPFGDGYLFYYTDAHRSGSPPSPDPALAVSRFNLVATLPCELEDPACFVGVMDVYELPRWTIMSPGEILGFPLLELPSSAPPFLDKPQDDESIELEYDLTSVLSIYGFTVGGGFDFNDYDHATFPSRVTHVSRTAVPIDIPGCVPDAPENLSPAGGQTGVSLSPNLQASSFSDPLPPAQTHAASRFQVTSVPGDYSDPVFDQVISEGDLTQAKFSQGLLKPGRTYYWRVRYRDGSGMWSDYSGETGFRTFPVTGFLMLLLCE